MKTTNPASSRTVTRRPGVQRLLTTGICAVLAIAIALPGTASAGLRDKAASAVSSARSKAATRAPVVRDRVKSTAQNGIEEVRSRVADTADKVNEIYALVDDFRPMMQNLGNGPLKNGIMEGIDYVQMIQAGYQNFAGPDNCGAGSPCHYFREDLRQLLLDFLALSEAVPSLNQDSGLLQRIENTIQLVDLVPSQMLYLLSQAAGPQLEQLLQIPAGIREKLEALPAPATPYELYIDPMSAVDKHCALMEDDVKVHAATLQALLKSASFTVKTVSGFLPEELTIGVTAVGGATITATKHPAQLPLKVVAIIIDSIDMGISNRLAIAASVCKVAENQGIYTPET